MIRIAHLLDDFGMGGVTRALTLFEEPQLTRLAKSRVIQINAQAKLAARIEADLIVDHMALSWRRLAFLASLRARHPNTRIVHVEHSYTRSFEQSNVPAKGRFRLMLKLAGALCNEIICVSHAQRNWLAHEVGIAAHKLRVIHPWTDRRELFDIPAATARHAEPVRLLTFGRYAPVKNFAELIRAMRLLPRGLAELTIFGDGPERGDLELLAAGAGNIIVHGPCSDPGKYLARCDAVIIPSRYEAFGLVAAEARMAGRAILVADVDGLPEQVGKGGLIAPMANAQDIAEAIHKAVRCDLANMGMKARANVQDQAATILRGWRDLIADVERSLNSQNCGLKEHRSPIG